MAHPDLSSTYSEALRELRTSLEADGYRMTVSAESPQVVSVAIDAGPDACADCLVPKPLLADILRAQLPSEVERIDLSYPPDAVHH